MSAFIQVRIKMVEVSKRKNISKPFKSANWLGTSYAVIEAIKKSAPFTNFACNSTPCEWQGIILSTSVFYWSFVLSMVHIWNSFLFLSFFFLTFFRSFVRSFTYTQPTKSNLSYSIYENVWIVTKCTNVSHAQ
jgi:hypothetical protein